MKVVCIKHFKSLSLQYELTYGKVYESLPKPNWSGDNTYFIKCDRDFISAYNKDIFITLEEWRNNQIEKICN